ncbi:MAG TPA: Omp28-related outer membrane protein, partial [Bacteroidales bacterium]|nr:Omp28-related outer membrane protein [Bacteroidales bacterium]
MKKFTIFLIGLLFLSYPALKAQQIARNKVIVEIGTGTWCQYCPGAALGADDLVSNGCEVGVIEYHNGDPFANAASDARNTYYNLTGFPTAHFDGVLEVVGGDHTQSMYASYLPKYNQRIAVPSSFKINMTFSHVGNDYTVNAQIIKLASYTGSNLVFQLALTESDIIYSWQGQPKLDFVERLMVPNQNGTALDFSANDTINLTENFTMDASWVAENCELVAFVQANSSKEILQGIKQSMALPEFDNDVALTNVYNIPAKTCDGIVTPEVKIKNKG